MALQPGVVLLFWARSPPMGGAGFMAAAGLAVIRGDQVCLCCYSHGAEFASDMFGADYEQDAV